MMTKNDEDIRLFNQEFADILEQSLKEAHLLLVNNQFKAAAIIYEYILQYIPGEG